MIEVQRMIDSAMKKGPKFPKFIHPYPAYVEQFEYPRARFTAQCGDSWEELQGWLRHPTSYQWIILPDLNQPGIGAEYLFPKSNSLDLL
ncbi:hypothetical protein ACFX2J_003373 [Malus domestica]